MSPPCSLPADVHLDVHIDLNSDLGEGFGVWPGGPDDELLALISSANVACGFHAGDPLIMRRTCTAAAARGVAVGAQVSYHDLAGFGRRFVDVEPGQLAAELLYQIGALQAIALACRTAVTYVKPHGALYNTAVSHEGHAAAVAAAAVDAGGLPVYGLPSSALRQAVERRGLRFVVEGFADRGYRDDGTLVPRGQPGALLSTAGDVQAQVLRLAATGAASICVHSDSPGAVDIARWAQQALLDTGYGIVAVTAPAP
jgi:UPF0271 protein